MDSRPIISIIDDRGKPVVTKKTRKKVSNADKLVNEHANSSLTSILETALTSQKEFDEWLTSCESQLDDDIVSFKIFDLQTIIDKRKALEDLYDEIEKFEPKNVIHAECIQRFCQAIPPSEERNEKKAMIRDTRSRVMRLRLRAVEQREIFRTVVPLLCRYTEYSAKMRPWLDEAETRSLPFIDKHENDVVLLECTDMIEALLHDLLEQKPIYEACLAYGELALHTTGKAFDDLQNELKEVIERWDALCMKLEKCLTRLDIAKVKMEEENNEAERIDRQMRREAHKCSCQKPFQIVRVAEGKYTFGSSRTVRLVRIHGSSVVVRVGGGWEFLYEFLKRCDPCRAKEYFEDGVESLKKLGLKPIDERRHSYAFESRRVYSAGTHSLSRGHSFQKELLGGEGDHDCCSVGSSIDSLDGASSTSDAGHACTAKAPRSTPKTPNRLPLHRKSSAQNVSRTADRPKAAPIVTLRPKSSTPTCAIRPVRRSLVERQGDFSEKSRLANVQRKLVETSHFS